MYRERDGYGMVLGEDDELCWYQIGGGLRWNSETRRRKKGGRGALIIQNDGLLVLRSDNTIIWCYDRSRIQPHEPLDVSASSSSVTSRARTNHQRDGLMLSRSQSTE